MFADIDSFYHEFLSLKNKFFPTSEIDLIYKRIDKASLRIKISTILFIDVYANTATRRYDFSVIKDRKRIFGFDNLEGWHFHSFNAPDDHINCTEPSLQHIFQELNKVINLL